MTPRLLVVDDDPSILNTVKEIFSREGYQVDVAEDAASALAVAARRPPDLLLLDWRLPDKPGVEVCRALRADPKTASLPIIMLTTLSGIKEKVDALDMGADDYVTKPFHVAELRSRVNALLRRKTPWLTQGTALESAGLTLDSNAFKASWGGKDLDLTRAEFDILFVLASHAGSVVRRSTLESRVLEIDDGPKTRALDTHLSRLRGKMGPRLSGRIETVRGAGYIYTPRDD